MDGCILGWKLLTELWSSSPSQHWPQNSLQAVQKTVQLNGLVGQGVYGALIAFSSSLAAWGPIVFQGTCSEWIWAAYAYLDAQEGVA